MWSITVGSVDYEDETAEVMVANSQGSAWGTIISESDPIYAQLLAAADAIIDRVNEIHPADASDFGQVIQP